MRINAHYLGLALLWSAVGAQPAAESEAATTEDQAIPVCEGEALERVSNGCVSAAVCAETAQEMGLQLGSELYPYAADWVDKGCFYFPPDHPVYPNQAYFGVQGTCSQLRVTPSEGGTRMSCDGNTQAPLDVSRCEGSVCADAIDCQAAALAQGLELGNERFPFEGPWVVKGCVFFSADHPEFPNQAFWGDGADICGQLRADPNDGSNRLRCDAVEEVEEEEEEEVVEPTEDVPVVSEPQEEAPVVTPPAVEESEPVVQVNATADANQTAAVPSPAPTPMPTTRPVPVNATAAGAGDEEEELTPAEPAATPIEDEEEQDVAQEPAVSPIDQNVMDKNQKADEEKNDKNDKDNKDEDEDEDDLGDTDLSVSRLQASAAIRNSKLVGSFVAVLLALV